MPELPDDPEAMFDAAVAAHEGGDLASAEGFYRRVIEIAGEDAVSLELLGAALLGLGRPQESRDALDRSVSLDPSSPTAWLHRAESCLALGDAEGAESDLRRCLALDPTQRSVALRLAVVAAEAGHAAEADELLRSWSTAPPSEDLAVAGARVLLARGELEAAVAALPSECADPQLRLAAAAVRLEASLLQGRSIAAAAACLRPEDATAVAARSALRLVREGRLDDAAAACLAVRALGGDDPGLRVVAALEKSAPAIIGDFRAAIMRGAWGIAAEPASLGMQALAQGDIETAVVHLSLAVAARPDLSDLASTLASLFLRLGRREEAIAALAEPLRIAPDDAALQHALGSAMLAGHRYVEAESALRRAVELRPDRSEPLLQLANLLLLRGRVGEAIELGRRIDPRSPDVIRVATGTADALSQSLRQREGLDLLREVCGRRPDSPAAQSEVLMLSNYVDDLSEDELLSEHLSRSPLIARDADPARTDRERRLALAELLSTRRRIRIGILSPDLRRHSVWFFIEPLIRELDRGAFELVAISDVTLVDPVTARLRALCDEWTSVAGLDDARCAVRIRDLRIDLLLELAGHTAHGRLAAIARRVAPVQASYLGYPNTSGIGAVDFRIVDGRTDPPGSDRLATETLLRMPRTFLCHMREPDAPPPRVDRPSRPTTFGCFNNLAKVTQTTLRLWASALAAVPGSLLLVKSRGFRDPSVASRLETMLAAHGVDPSRLRLRQWEPHPHAHLRAYEEVDVALDTFPYHGTTTTCEALSMGVPVVTMAGPAHRSRVGASLLHAIGRPDLVAEDESSFAQIAGRTCEEVGRPRRDLLDGTPLRDAPGFARDFQSMLRDAADAARR